jgi:hypothetical protein
VKRLLPFVSLGFLNYAGRLLVTLFATAMLLLALNLVNNAKKMLRDSVAGFEGMVPHQVGNPAGSSLGNLSVHPLWPEFPHGVAGNLQSTVINGVQTMTEEWQCNASPEEVLSYYRDQMPARGWQDATEKTYGSDFQLSELGAIENLPQGQETLKKYRAAVDSNLMLKKGEWSLRISTEPANDPRQITVKFCAAASPSMENFFMGMSSGLVAKKGANGKPMDVVQENGSGRNHTTIATKNETPAQAFQEALAKYVAQGWRPVMMLPKERTPSGYFAWLVRGKQYAALSVNISPQAQSTSVTFTEVTPDH